MAYNPHISFRDNNGQVAGRDIKAHVGVGDVTTSEQPGRSMSEVCFEALSYIVSCLENAGWWNCGVAMGVIVLTICVIPVIRKTKKPVGVAGPAELFGEVPNEAPQDGHDSIRPPEPDGAKDQADAPQVQVE